MTNTPDSDKTGPTTESAAPKTKTKKPKGPIRWEAIIPVAVVFIAVSVYGALFLDHHLRKGLEFVATRANGAEVNVASLSTSFFRASLEIRGLEFTDTEKPAQNSLKVDRVGWRMLWDALLRGKIAIEEAAIEGIAIQVPRSRPGFVLPKPPPPKESALDKLKAQALDQAETEFSKNILGDVAGLLKGNDVADQLKSIEGSLASGARVKALQAELGDKEKAWKDRIEKLPKPEQIRSYDERIKKVKLGGFSNPAEAQKSLEELSAILSEAGQKANEIKATGEAVSKETAAFQSSIKELESLVQKDVRDLESRLKLPSVDADSLSRMLFGPRLFAKFEKAQRYMAMARKYIPPKKTKAQLDAEKAEKAAAVSTPRERSKGRTYAFGRPNSYPLFWLKRAAISSKSSPGGLSGDVEGKIEDVTNDQNAIGKPLVATLKGDFPAQKVQGAAIQLTIDHRNEVPVERLTVDVARFAAPGQTLVNSPDVQLGFDEASGTSRVLAELAGENVQIALTGSFDSVTYKTDAKEAILADLLKRAVADVPRVTYSANVLGTWAEPKFTVDTNLGRALAASLEKQLRAKIEEARGRIRGLVDEKIGAEKAKLLSQFKLAEGSALGGVRDKQAEVDKLKTRIETAKSDAVKSQTKGLEDQGKKALDGLKKGFGF